MISRLSEEFGDGEKKRTKESRLGGSLALPSRSKVNCGRANLLMSQTAFCFLRRGGKGKVVSCP